MSDHREVSLFGLESRCLQALDVGEAAEGAFRVPLTLPAEDRPEDPRGRFRWRLGAVLVMG